MRITSFPNYCDTAYFTVTFFVFERVMVYILKNSSIFVIEKIRVRKKFCKSFKHFCYFCNRGKIPNGKTRVRFISHKRPTHKHKKDSIWIDLISLLSILQGWKITFWEKHDHSEIVLLILLKFIKRICNLQRAKSNNALCWIIQPTLLKQTFVHVRKNVREPRYEYRAYRSPSTSNRKGYFTQPRRLSCTRAI